MWMCGSMRFTRRSYHVGAAAQDGATLVGVAATEAVADERLDVGPRRRRDEQCDAPELVDAPRERPVDAGRREERGLGVVEDERNFTAAAARGGKGGQ